MGNRRFSFMTVLLSIVGAVIAFAMGEAILGLGSKWPSFVMVGLYFGIGAMVVATTMMISQKISPDLVGQRWREIYFKNSLKLYIPVTLIMVGLVSGLFQFIYSTDIHQEKTIKNIVIAVDISGSMEITDPDRERFKAINTLVDNLKGKKQVAVVIFNDEAQVAIPFMPVASQSEKEAFKTKLEELVIQDEGQTGIIKAVNTAYNLLNGASGKGSLILVSDGAPTDDSYNDISGLVKNYVEESIPIYTIGMMYGAPEEAAYLQEIADATGGICYNTSDTTMLQEVFGKISYNEDKGTIITNRSGSYVSSRFYGVLRVIFLLAVSLIMALAFGILFDNRYLVQGMMIGALIGGSIGSFGLERMMAAGILPIFARLIYWVSFGIAIMSFTWCIHFKDSYHGTREA